MNKVVNFIQPLHADNTPDERYSCAREFCGQPRRVFVVRYCNDYLATCDTMSEANYQARVHRNNTIVTDILDTFTRGYLQGFFFTESIPGLESRDYDESMSGAYEGTIPSDCDYSDFANGQLWEIRAECTEFQARASNLLIQAIGESYTYEQAGIDFWLTRNGHGAGFWDRGLPDDIGAGLTDIAQSYKEVFPFYQDGMVYHND